MTDSIESPDPAESIPVAQNPSNSDLERDPMDIALTEFSDELREGRTPSIDSYAGRYPELAPQIRDLFPLVFNLERWKNDKEIECLRRNVPTQFAVSHLGEYQIVRELGRGGMGVVFEAVHSVSQRPVAIKLLPWRFAADMSVWKERLQREATTIAALQHPNIVPIYSFAEDQGYYFYVMQLIDGVGLDKTIQRLQHLRHAQGSSRRRLLAASAPELTLTPDSWRGFARIGEQVALALSYAHQQSILHNDIKPSNLLIRVNGQVIVTDFGIGRMLPNNLSEADEHAVGTLKYMAPERLTEGGRAESDVYSLGATLYELVTQTSIFDMGKRLQLVNAILHQSPLPPRACNPEIPRSLESIILKAIAKVPADRYPTAREMAIDLRRFINRQPIHATSRGLWQRAVDWYQKRMITWRR